MATAVINELPVIICVLNNGYLGMVRQYQDLFYEVKSAGTCLRRNKNCDKRGLGCAGCNGRSAGCPEYVPDFVKLAEAYDAQGIRVTKVEEIDEAFAKAKAKKDGPTIIEFIIEDKELVFPMVKPNGSISDQIIDRQQEVE